MGLKKLTQVKNISYSWTDFFTYTIFVFILAIVCGMMYFGPETAESYTTSIHTRTLKEDGFRVLCDKRYLEYDDTNYDIGTLLREDVLNCLPNGYAFIHYVYKIDDVELFTFHRDVTSSKHFMNTQHPVYTLILYKNDGFLLSVCPGSHASYPFVWSNIVNIRGIAGTAFLFDCDLLHAGFSDLLYLSDLSHNRSKRSAVQYKICHVDDLPRLHSLCGVNMSKTSHKKNDSTSLVMMKRITRKLSYYFEWPIHIICYPFMMKREKENSFVGKLQSWIPLSFYNNG